MLHLRYNFRNPPLRARDYTAIEHQVSLRLAGISLELLFASASACARGAEAHATPAAQNRPHTRNALRPVCPAPISFVGNGVMVEGGGGASAELCS